MVSGFPWIWAALVFLLFLFLSCQTFACSDKTAVTDTKTGGQDIAYQKSKADGRTQIGEIEIGLASNESSELITAKGMWEGETSLTAEDIRKLKNWPDTLLEWLEKAWKAFVEWFERVLGN